MCGGIGGQGDGGKEKGGMGGMRKGGVYEGKGWKRSKCGKGLREGIIGLEKMAVVP